MTITVLAQPHGATPPEVHPSIPPLLRTIPPAPPLHTAIDPPERPPAPPPIASTPRALPSGALLTKLLHAGQHGRLLLLQLLHALLNPRVPVGDQAIDEGSFDEGSFDSGFAGWVPTSTRSETPTQRWRYMAHLFQQQAAGVQPTGVAVVFIHYKIKFCYFVKTTFYASGRLSNTAAPPPTPNVPRPRNSCGC